VTRQPETQSEGGRKALKNPEGSKSKGKQPKEEGGRNFSKRKKNSRINTYRGAGGDLLTKGGGNRKQGSLQAKREKS